MGKLPSPIPGNVYRHVEHRLRHREAILRRALQELAQAEGDAGAIRSPGAESVGGGNSSSDRVCSAAIRIAEARSKVEKAKVWLRVYRWTMDVFAGTDAGRAMKLIFEKSVCQAEAARQLNCDRQTVRRYKDDFVIRASFLAVSWGLIRMNFEGRVREDEFAGETQRVSEDNGGDVGREEH